LTGGLQTRREAVKPVIIWLVRHCTHFIGRRGLRAALGAAAVLAMLVTGAWAATSTPKLGRATVVTDHSGDAPDDGVDLVRVSFGRAPGGLLRASITSEDNFSPTDLRAKTGPPGSICLDLWTVTTASANPPDYLVCVTADAEGDALRATVMHERSDQLPQFVGSASVTRSSEHNVTLRFAQSAIGSPATIAFAAESTQAGCPRASCIDMAPDAPGVATLPLRATSAATG
jgi:hypothetical protein